MESRHFGAILGVYKHLIIPPRSLVKIPFDKQTNCQYQTINPSTFNLVFGLTGLKTTLTPPRERKNVITAPIHII